ncbi:Uncharacterised protein [Burkholderia pseudomallei]|uniref:hypothetical protein n=1 Tax=Burkholderia pseudomallei TaxID=28450 RepID=UPI000F07A051|nr:hypothetical protein [Burkholderia pseudomallei]CAJ7239339.1 Uncharacterised protein [Burkholderia pseudomallei]
MLADVRPYPKDVETMQSNTRLTRVDIAFLYQLAGMTVGDETPADLQAKAFSAYRAARKRVAADYEKLASARKEDGSPAYRLEAIAGLAEPRDGAKVFALWFSSAGDFTRAAKVDLMALCGQRMFDAAYDQGISSYFMGARQVRKLETEEWDEIL